MRAVLAILTGFVVLCAALLSTLALAVGPAVGQQADAAPFDIKLDEQTRYDDNTTGVNVKKIQVKFTVSPRKGAQRVADGKGWEVVIYENFGGQDREVKRVPLPTIKVAEGLSVILALDESGSMAETVRETGKARVQMAREATAVFFEKLPRTSDVGLILFNHKIIVQEPLTQDRGKLIQDILHVSPHGGTAYLDATVQAVRMLQNAAHNNKAVVVMTDGADLNSTTTLGEAIDAARKAGVKVYTIGIGKPGTQEKVTSVLVLDRSGSMLETASDTDKVSKIVALKKAGHLFMSFVREGMARTMVLDFSDAPGVPDRFSSDKRLLKQRIDELKPDGETALFDAVYDAVVALEAEHPEGKRAVVALTDGIDNSSRRRVEEVIAEAKAAKIPLYLLGFGRPGELDEGVMKRMADETGGEYFPARNEKALMDIFEKLSNRLHDDGINVADLTKLAVSTGGRYYHAEKISDMQLMLEKVVQDVQSRQFTETFTDLDQTEGGTRRAIRVALAHGGEVVQDVRASIGTHGLVIPEVNHFVYLGLLGLIGLLIALPAGLRRLGRSES
jgi:VWFA-related protein